MARNYGKWERELRGKRRTATAAKRNAQVAKNVSVERSCAQKKWSSGFLAATTFA